MPAACYAYPYGFWFRRWGDQVEMEPLEVDGFLNAVTVVQKAPKTDPEEPELALEHVPEPA